jgi:hypothetical protein
MLTVVCKATYVLQPGEAQLAGEQEYINEDDNHWNDDPARSLYSPSDLVPFKIRCDVMLVGHAFAPRGEPVRSLTAHIQIGEVDKAISIFGERAWGQDGQLRELSRFTKMPLRYERAAGGPETANPVGVRLDGRPDPYGNIALPNLQPPGFHLSAPGQLFDPIGFGPLAPSWPARREKLGRHARGWSDATWSARPLPEDIDPLYFNASPRDQQVQELRDNERIVLENLHPSHARLVTSLPGIRPQAFLVRPGAAASELPLKCDTLWIDTDRSLCTMTWRSQVKLDRPDQPGRILIAMAQPGQRLTFEDVRAYASSRATSSSSMAEEQTSVTLDVEPEPESGRTTIAPGPVNAALPFASTARGPTGKPLRQTAPVPPALPSPSEPFNTKGDATLSGKVNDGTPAWLSRTSSGSLPSPASVMPAQPPAVVAPPPVAPPVTPPPPPVTNPVISPPPVVPSVSPAAPARVESPWATMASGAGGAGGAAGAAGSAPFGQDAASRQSSPPLPVAPPIPPPRQSTPGLAMPAVPPAPVAIAGAAAGVSVGSTASTGSALSASNAAASASAWASANPAPLPPDTPLPSAAIRSAPRAPGGREVTDLLWFDPEFMDRIREEPKWKKLIASLRPKAPDLDESDPFEDAPSKSPDKEKADDDRRDVYGVLTRAETTDLEGVNEAIADAVKEDGTFIRPLVVLAGDITFPFDELETLKATVTAVTPLIAGDKKLKETVDTVNELLKTPWLQSGTGVAEGLTGRVKEAFAQGNRMLPPSYLETHTERILLEQRHYQKRTVFGEPWIRSLFSPPGSSSSQMIPAYLPESLSKKLPMFQTMRVRIIAEAHLQQDQYETHPSALRVIAIGRVASLSGSMRSGSRA